MNSPIPIGADGEIALSSSLYRRVESPPAFVLVPSVLVGLAMLLPVAYLIFRVIGASNETWELLFRSRTAFTVGRTALLVLTVTASSVAIAIPMAWLTVRTDLPLRRLWSVVMVLPLVLPSFVGAFLFISALGPRGILQQMLEPYGVERLPEIYGLFGATLTLTLLSYPYVLFTVRGALRNMDFATEEAARALGHGALSTMFRITLPQLRPAIGAGSVLVGLYALSDFGAVSLMRYPTFTWVIFQQYESAFDRAIAAVFSLMLVAMAIVILVVEGCARGRKSYYLVGPGVSRPLRLVRLGLWKWPALLFCAGLAVFALGIPMAILVHWLIRGVSAGEPLLVLWNETWNSIFVSGLAALIAALFSIPMAVLVVRYSGRLSRFLERISFTGYALPGVVVALALVFLGAKYIPVVYQTIWLLVFAYLVLFFPAALGATRTSLLQLSPRVEEAARGLGWSSIQVMRQVTAPLVAPGISMGAALVFLITIKELPATLILGPLGFKTLATAVWSASSEAFFAQAAAPALMLVLISLVPMGFLVMRERTSTPVAGKGAHSD